jgi:hypothetical protein
MTAVGWRLGGKWGLLAMAASRPLRDGDLMIESRDHTEEERELERRHERQGWLLLTGGFALAALLVVAASFL